MPGIERRLQWMEPMDGLTSGQLAAAADVNPQTLRYYERRGLLGEPPRSESKD